MTFDQLIQDSHQHEDPEMCLHTGIAWREVRPGRDGRLHARCPQCQTPMSRAAFPAGRPTMAKAEVRRKSRRRIA